MILYHTTHRDDPFTSGFDVNSVARQWFAADHFTFATEPLAGQGPYVFSIDIPSSTVEPYMFTNTFRREEAQHFALPRPLIQQAQPTRDLYADLTGTDWNTAVVTVMDRRPRKGEPNLVGSWALIWISRPGVAKARVHSRTEDTLELEVQTTSEFDPERDYIIVEEHEEFLSHHNEPPKETWELHTIAGNPPQWQIFPSAWQDWVANAQVSQSAIAYMMRVIPELARDIQYAQHLESKHNRARAWRSIADQLSLLLSQRLGRSVDLGKFAGHSWTAVMAIPLRIAMRLGQYVDEEWVPPVPKPEFQHPDQSGRVLLANNYGAYPTRGPGVDHAPQDRPHEKRGGELRQPQSPRPPLPRTDPSTSTTPRW